jgi:large subunit ribosomal protein L10
MSKLVKKMVSDDLRKTFAGVRDLVVVSVNGIDGIQNNTMRLALRQKNIRIHVLKNSLAKRVFDELPLAPATQYMEGPSAVVWGGPSIVELTKEITAWVAKVNKLQIRGAVTAGQALSPEQVVALSKLPSREELISRVVMLATSPARRVSSLISSPAARLASQLKTKAEPEGAAAEPAPPA